MSSDTIVGTLNFDSDNRSTKGLLWHGVILKGRCMIFGIDDRIFGRFAQEIGIVNFYDLTTNVIKFVHYNYLL